MALRAGQQLAVGNAAAQKNKGGQGVKERKRRRVNPTYETQKWRYIDIYDGIYVK